MSDIEKNKLAPCPFCGSDDTRVISLDLVPQRVKCADCGSQAYYDTWNTRPAELVPLDEDKLLSLFETFQMTTDTYNKDDFPCIPQWNFKDLIHFICKEFAPPAASVVSVEDIKKGIIAHFGFDIIKVNSIDNDASKTAEQFMQWFYIDGLAESIHTMLTQGKGKENGR